MARRKVLQAGDSSKAVCRDCAAIVPVTYGYYDLPIRQMDGIARNILAGACDRCGGVVLVPAQSAPHIRYWIERSTPPVRLTLSRAELEIFDTHLARVHHRLVPEGRTFAFHYAFRQLSRDPLLRDHLLEVLPYFKAEILAVLQHAQAKNLKIPDRRLRLTGSPQQVLTIRELAGTMGLTLSDLGRAAILVFREAEKELPAAQLKKFRADVLTQLFARV